jgi:hypothetical protein
MDEVDLLMFAVSVLNFLFVVGVIWLIRKWKGGWRIATVVVGVSYLLALAWTALDSRLMPGRHNLLPFEVAIWAGGGLVVLAAMALVHFMVDHAVPGQ